MSRWEPNARGRLEEAALELYGERGFDQTTAAEIAQRAGLTERTFFRHFADKREVLFWGERVLHDLFVEAMTDAPTSAGPVEVVTAGLDAVTGLFDGRRDHARRRQAVIDANSELQERELMKLSTLAGATAEVLRRRGVTEPSASLAAETAITVFKVAFGRWIHDEDAALRDVIHESLHDLRDVLTP